MSVLLKTIAAYFSAIRFIFKHRLYYYIFIPGIISFLAGGLLLYLGWTFTDNIGLWLAGMYPDNWWGSNWIDEGGQYISFVLMIILLFVLFKHIVLVFTGPFMSQLSYKTEMILNPETTPIERESGMLADFLRGLKLSFRNIFFETGLLLVLLVLGLIPVVNIVTTVLAFIVSAYYAGFGNLDVTLERRFSFSETVSFVKNNRLMATANGALFLAILLIPVAGVFLAPALATVAATKILLENKL